MRSNVTLLVGLGLLTLLFSSARARGEDSLSAQDSRDERPNPGREITQFEPPVTIVEANELLDGGTTFVRLRDAKNRELLLAVSQFGSEATIPANTLFLDANHPFEESARLAVSQAEAELVVDSLEQAVNAALTSEERQELRELGDPAEALLQEGFRPSGVRQTPERWAAIHAFDALRRLRRRKEPIDVCSASAGAPKWYDVYEMERTARAAEQEQARKAEEEFLACYPADVRELFAPTVSDGADPRQREKEQGKLLAQAMRDRVALVLATCRALGTRHEGWTVTSMKDRIAIFAVEGIDGEDFSAALARCGDDASVRLGAARIFISLGFANKLPVAQRGKWAVTLARAVVESDLDGDKPYVLAFLSRLNEVEAAKLLWQVAQGEVGREMQPSELLQGPSLRATAYLALARRKDPRAEKAIRALIDQAEGEDRRTYEVSLALLGDAALITNDNFATKSTIVAISAIRAIESFKGAEGMDVLFNAALDHPYAAVANEAILAAERLTAQKWIPNGDRSQPRSHRDKAVAWWKTNRERFLTEMQAK